MLSSFYYEKGGISLQNQFILNVDLKRLYSADTPKFRRGDTVVILFNFFDDGEELSLSSATKAMIHQKTSKGNIIESECTFTTYNGKRVVRFEVEDIAMVEIGYLNLLLTVWRDKDVVSIQPFNVYVYDDYMGGAGSFIELIQELQRQIETMVLDMNNAIKLTEKGVPNGVATLDATGKIPLAQLPTEIDAYLKHTTETIYEHQSHGLKLDNDGLLMYLNKNGDWQYVGFSDEASGAGAPQAQLLDATIEMVDGIATITYSGIPTIASSKWTTGTRETSYFILSGTSFTGTTFNISSLGMHTLYYKDSNGVEYSKQFNVEASMMNKPSIPIEIEDGFVTITPPTSPTISIKKWAKGSQTVSYFAYNGTTFTGNTFEVAEIGTYTIYVKTSSGLEYVYEFNVSLVDLKQPEISVSVTLGAASVSHTPNYVITARKWSIGTRNVSYFTSSGTAFTGVSFLVDTVSEYTVYHKYNNGIEAVKTFTVTASGLPAVDITPPNLTLSATSGYTSVTITASATDSESGVYSIKKPDNSIVYVTSATHVVSVNGTYSFTATDNRGNVATKSIVVSSIDTVAPTISLSYSPTTSTNGTVTITPTITDIASGVKTKKWAVGNQSLAYFTSSGIVFTSASFTVSSNDTYTIYAVDNAGNGVVQTIAISNINTVPPSITLSQSPTSWTNGSVTVTANITSASGTISSRKWASGNRTISYFASSGTTFTSTFSVSVNDTYTIYTKDSSGNEAVKTITISNIDSIAPILTLSQTSSGANKLITATATDNGSGVHSIEKPDGTLVYGASTTYTAYGNGTYEFLVKDSAGNSSTKSINVTGIVVNSTIQYNMEGDTIYKIDTDGTVYTQGENSAGKRGIGLNDIDTSHDSNTPEKSLISGVTQVVASNITTYFLTKSGDVYLAGHNGAGGSNSTILPNSSYSTPTKIPNISGATKLVFTSASRTLFYQVANSDWYGLGYNRNGEMGIGYNTTTNNGYITTPTKISYFISPIVGISNAAGCSVFTLENGTTYICGRISIPGTKYNTIANSPESWYGASAPIKSVTLDYRGENAYLILKNNTTQVLGQNANGELGLGHQNVISVPTINTSLAAVTKIVAGAGATLAMKSNGTILGMGEKVYLGLSSSYGYQTTPTTISFSGTGKDIFMSDYNGLIQTTVNRLYGMGVSQDNLFANGDANISGTSRLTNLE